MKVIVQGVVAAFVALAAIQPASAEARDPAPDDYRALNLELVDTHVLPRYERLAEMAGQLERVAGGYCTERDRDSEAALRAAWTETADAWQGIQHLRFGPVELFMRSMRMQFWPDPRNTVGRQLEELIAAGDPAGLEPDTFARSTISVQGLPALERLMPDPSGESAIDTSGSDFGCSVLQAIAANIAAISADTLSDWREGARAYRDVIANAAGEGGHYHVDSEVTQDFFKSLHAILELVADHKLQRPLGESLQTARPQLAEAWRSGRSLSNIRANLAAAEAMYVGENGGSGFSRFVRDVTGDKALDDLFRRAFAQTRASAAAIGMPLEEAVADADERRKVEKLAREAGALRSLVAQRLTVALGIPLGFNSLDGD